MKTILTLFILSQSLISASWCQKLFDLNPDIFRNTPELIRSRGFDYEQHSITTADGYILTVYRIVNPYLRLPLPNGRRRPRPLLLWHGVAVTSDSWLFSTTGRINASGIYVENNNLVNDCNTTVTDTLGYTLAACGYDVWLGNSRGSQYSNGHTEYDASTDVRYWQFTMTEMAIYDVPAVIAYILRQTTETSLAYVGHSLGTDLMFALQSLIPEIGRLIQPFIALAPVAYIGEIWSSARLGVPLEPLLKLFPGPLGLPAQIMQLIGIFICGNDLLVDLCADVLYSINGFDPINFNRTIVPVNVAHSAVPTSTWVYAHLAQMVATKQYQMFDLGSSQNLVRYGSAEPPVYPLQNITSPHIALFRGLNDPLADSLDVNHLVTNLTGLPPNEVISNRILLDSFPLVAIVTLLDNYIVPYSKWNHQDFQLGSSQGFYVNKRLIRILRQFD